MHCIFNVRGGSWDPRVLLQDLRITTYQPRRFRWRFPARLSLVVEGVSADNFGGIELALSGDFRLQVIPCGSRGEDWRFFAPGSEEDHLVINGGLIIESGQTEIL